MSAPHEHELLTEITLALTLDADGERHLSVTAGNPDGTTPGAPLIVQMLDAAAQAVQHPAWEGPR